VTLGLPSWLATLQAFCLNRKPKAKVVTFMDYFSMNLHAGIAFRPLHLRLRFHYKFYLNHLWVILK